MSRISTYTIGADPELFIINSKTGKVVSSIGLIPGEKGNPWVGDDMPKGFGLEIDNILAEFNIPPVTDRRSFITNIEYMKGYIRRFVQDKNPDLDILCKASMEVPEDQLQSPEAKEFGCSVDYNVYTESPNPKPRGEETNLRSAGFHIHLGYNDYNPATSVALIKYMDITLGLVSVLLDDDVARRSLYGKAGSFRLTEYGLEYRVLSSKMMSSKDYLELVYDGVILALKSYNSRALRPSTEDIRRAIDTSDKSLAYRILKSYEYYPSEKLDYIMNNLK